MIYIAALENWDDPNGRYITITHSGLRNEVDPIGVAPGQDWVEALEEAGWKIASGKRMIRGRKCFVVVQQPKEYPSDASQVVAGFISSYPQAAMVARIIVEQDNELMPLRRWFRAVICGEGGGVPVALMLGISDEDAQDAYARVTRAGGLGSVDWDAVAVMI